MYDNRTVKEVTPDPKRLIDSLRNVGYSFHTAVADVIDNSIEAGATEIHINVSSVGSNSSVRIADNGKGMMREDLIEAMRMGTNREYSESDLGKFGLGLKTASFSQCRSFSVGSRSEYMQDISVLAWDMDHVEKTSRWEVVDLTSEKDTPDVQLCHSFLDDTSGTVIIWKQLNMIQDYKDPNGKPAKNGLKAACHELEIHLSMVFHRFMDNRYRKNPIKFFLNNNLVEPWDPFALEQIETQQLTPVHLQAGIGNTRILLEPFVLPRKDQFDPIDKFDDYAGPGKWNRQQGFYVYRADRMIQSGGWCGLRTQDEHHKLARIALHFPTELDDFFKINVSKMTVIIPDSLKNEIEKAISPVVEIANTTYRKKSDPGTGPSFGGRSRGRTKRRYTLSEVRKILNETANEDEWPTVENVFDRAFDAGENQ